MLVLGQSPLRAVPELPLVFAPPAAVGACRPQAASSLMVTWIPFGCGRVVPRQSYGSGGLWCCRFVYLNLGKSGSSKG